MPLPDEADNVARPIYDDCKQAGDVAAQHAHIECLPYRDSGILAPEDDLGISVTSEPNLGFYDDRILYPADTSQTILGRSGLGGGSGTLVAVH